MLSAYFVMHNGLQIPPRTTYFCTVQSRYAAMLTCVIARVYILCLKAWLLIPIRKYAARSQQRHLAIPSLINWTVGGSEMALCSGSDCQRARFHNLVESALTHWVQKPRHTSPAKISTARFHCGNCCSSDLCWRHTNVMLHAVEIWWKRCVM